MCGYEQTHFAVHCVVPVVLLRTTRVSEAADSQSSPCPGVQCSLRHTRCDNTHWGSYQNICRCTGGRTQTLSLKESRRETDFVTASNQLSRSFIIRSRRLKLTDLTAVLSWTPTWHISTLLVTQPWNSYSQYVSIKMNRL